MREIKFRAWIPDEKDMAYFELIDLATGHHESVTERTGRVVELFYGQVMQYTGLKDKNGKEIYEGDIILWGDRVSRAKGNTEKVVVEYRSACFGVSTKKEFYEFWHYMPDKWGNEEIRDGMWGRLPIEKYLQACFEVIGNIYENPELLEVAK